MKKRTGMTMLAVIAAGMMTLSPLTAVAGIEEAGQIVDGSKLTLSDFVEDKEVVLTKSNYLGDGMIRVNNLGNHVLGVSGSTNCHVVCDTVICNLFLEQKDEDGIWYTYDYWNYSTTNDHALVVATTRNVEGGHWYRARGAHIAIKNNAIESISTETDGIWVK